MSVSQHGDTRDETRAFSQFINQFLKDEAQLHPPLPLDENSNDALFEACRSGVLISVLINHVRQGTVDTNKMKRQPRNPFETMQNHVLTLSAARTLGLVTVNIGPQDLAAGTPHLVLGLLWQIIRLKLVENVRIDRQPALIALKGEEEDIDSFVNLKPEDQLLRWLNHHLAAASGGGRRVNNFGQDLADGDVFIRVLHRLAPHLIGLDAINLPPEYRAAAIIEAAKQLGVKTFHQPNDILHGNRKLNMALVAGLFDVAPQLEKDARTAAYGSTSAYAQTPAQQAAAQQRQQMELQRAMQERLRREEAQFRQRLAEEEAFLRQKWQAEEDARREKVEQWERDAQSRVEASRQEVMRERARLEEEARQRDEERRRLDEDYRQLEASKQAYENYSVPYNSGGNRGTNSSSTTSTAYRVDLPDIHESVDGHAVIESQGGRGRGYDDGYGGGYNDRYAHSSSYGGNGSGMTTYTRQETVSIPHAQMDMYGHNATAQAMAMQESLQNQILAQQQAALDGMVRQMSATHLNAAPQSTATTTMQRSYSSSGHTEGSTASSSFSSSFSQHSSQTFSQHHTAPIVTTVMITPSSSSTSSPQFAATSSAAYSSTATGGYSPSSYPTMTSPQSQYTQYGGSLPPQQQQQQQQYQYNSEGRGGYPPHRPPPEVYYQQPDNSQYYR